MFCSQLNGTWATAVSERVLGRVGLWSDRCWREMKGVWPGEANTGSSAGLPARPSACMAAVPSK